MYAFTLTLSVLSSALTPCEGIVVTQRTPTEFWNTHQNAIDRMVPSIAKQGLRFVEDLERTLHEGATRSDTVTLSPCAKLKVEAIDQGYLIRFADLSDQIIKEERLTTEAKSNAPTKPLGLKAALRKLADELALQMKTVDPDALYREWAVFPFEAPADSDLGKLVAGELQVGLIRDQRAMLIERSQVGKVADEYAIQWSGLAEEKVAQDAGALLGADYLVLGEVPGRTPHRTSARVVRVVDGRVMTSAAVDLPANDLVALSADSVVLKSKTGALFRSLLIPGWGQSYNLEPTKAWIFGGFEALGASAAIWAHLRYQNKNDTYRSLGVNGDFDSAAQSAERAYELRNSSLIGLALVHAVNIIDAYLSGVDPGNQTARLTLEGNGGMLAWAGNKTATLQS